MSRPKAYGYIRVSSLKQVDNTSPEVQRSSVDAYFRWAMEKTHDWGGFYEDLGTSGGVKLRERPGGKVEEKYVPGGADLFRIVQKGDAVIFPRLDRGFRDPVDCAVTIREWSERGVSAHFLDLRVDTTTSMGEMLMGIMAYVAQYWRRLHRERILEAYVRKRERGDITNGKPRYGFVKNGKGKGKYYLQPDPRQRLLGSYIVKLYDEDDLSFDKIWLRLRVERKRNPLTQTYLTNRQVARFYNWEKELRKIEAEGAFNGTRDHPWFHKKKAPAATGVHGVPANRGRRSTGRVQYPPPKPRHRTDGRNGSEDNGQDYGPYQG